MELQETNAIESYEVQDNTMEAAFAEGLAQEESAEPLAAEAPQPEARTTEDAAENTSESKDEGQQGTPTLKLKYLGREMELPQNEVVTLAQKGMNYDHLQNRLQQVEKSAEFAILDRYAAIAGMNRQEYLQFLEQQAEEAELQPYIEKGIDAEEAKGYMENRRKAEMMDGLQQKIEQKMQEQEQQRQAIDQQLLAFIAKYPDVKKFPPKVMDDIRGGMTPLEAYAQYETAELRNKLAATTQNVRNRSSHVGSVAGTTASEDGDVFLQGFLSTR